MIRNFFSLFIILLSIDCFACTSAIFTGKATPDGRPLLWKNRDTGELNNRIDFFPASNNRSYSFLALVNSPADEGEAWMGTNSVGFSIMNTASYNIQNVKADVVDMEGVVMFKALSSCRTLKDFEILLDNYPRPMGVEANFGVIDAQGGAAYYEVNNTEWIKFDVNDPSVAPDGYIVYTNYSYAGREDEGMGYIRAEAAKTIIEKAYAENESITPHWIFDNLSRSYFNPILGVDLKKDEKATPNGWYCDADFIPRRITSASIVVKGVKVGENPDLTVMWTILGYAPCSYAVPLMVCAADVMPAQMTSVDKKGNCVMCDAALTRRKEVFSIRRGNGKYYLNFTQAKKWMDILSPVERKIADGFATVIEEAYSKNFVDKDSVKKYYDTIDFVIE